ncbi:MAG: hypothetical protein P8Y00_00335 [Deltaproteobacteria bacterium]
MGCTRKEAERMVADINRKSLQYRLVMARVLLDKGHHGLAKALIDAVSSEILAYETSGEIMSEGGRETFSKKEG